MKKLLMAAALCTAFAAGPAAARMYVGGGIGASRTDTTEKSWKLYSGFQFSPTWGMELAYNDLGRYRNADIKIGLRLEYEDFGRLSKSPTGADSRG